MEDPPPDTLERSAPARRIDARGHRCPTPSLRLRRALEALAPGQRVLLVADDPMARIDVPYLVADRGDLMVDRYEEGLVLYFLVEKR